MGVEEEGGAEFGIGGVFGGVVGVVDAGGCGVDYFGVPIFSIVGNSGCGGGSWFLAVVVGTAAFNFTVE